MLRAGAAGVVILVTVGLVAPLMPRASADEAMPATIPVTILTASGTHTIQAEVACSIAERAQGLMKRESLAPESGMIFLLPAPRPMRLWMKNTPLALDMIFFNLSHNIIIIEHDTKPMSEHKIESGGAVVGVLELAGGRAHELGISHGDKLLYTYPQEHCE